MGTYLVPGARSVFEVAEYAMPGHQSTLTVVEEGVLIQDPTRTDAELAALYAGFEPSGSTDEQIIAMLPRVLRAHAGHLRDFRDAVRDGVPVTNAQTLHVIADIIDWVRLSDDRL